MGGQLNFYTVLKYYTIYSTQPMNEITTTTKKSVLISFRFRKKNVLSGFGKKIN